ncbi:MAG: leucine-rich repeat domain-containing protein [Clostridia bacterium]|nr:leucine-rich repeat domain-containing protein [Clostridia bacterium]
MITGYTGTDKTIVLEDDFAGKDILNGAIPSDVKLLCNPDSNVAKMYYFTEHSFYALENPDFEYQYLATADMKTTLIAYHGTEKEITIPAGTALIADNAIPSTVTLAHLDNMVPIFDNPINAWPESFTNGQIQVYAEPNSQYILSMRNNAYATYSTFFVSATYPNVYYTVEYGNVCLAGVATSSATVTLPGYYTSLSASILGQYNQWIGFGYDLVQNPFTPFNVPIYVPSGSPTAKLLDTYGIPYNVQQTVKYSLPAALVEIEDEAFMDSAFEEVTISSGCTTIGAYAFANSKSLVAIHIPSSVTNIDTTAFSGCSKVIIYCKTGSAAETFAQTLGLPYVTEP